MEMQINELVSAIKKEGVEAAKIKADEIISQANEKADAIIKNAKIEADNIIKSANQQIEVLKQSAKTTAEHAKRDAMLFFKKSVQQELGQLLEENVEKAVDQNVLAKLILAAVNNEEPSNYVAEVGEITQAIKSELANKTKQGLEIKVNPNIKVGFKLTAKDGSGYFDCSDEELNMILAPFFPELTI